MNINFDYFKVFCQVAESKSITEAANQLNISQPAITKTIKLLEEELNTSLFYRKHSGSFLTEEGQNLYNYIKPLILQVNEAPNIVKNIDNIITIRIGTSITVLRYFLIDKIREFNENHPNIKIYIEDNNTPNLINKIKDGTIDIAIIIGNENTKNKFTNIKVHKIKNLKYGLFANKNYLNKINETISIKKLKDYNFIINCNNSFFKNFVEKNNLDNVISASSSSFIFDFIESSTGIGIVIKEFMKTNKNIHEIKIEEELPKSELLAITNNNKYQNLAVSYFLNEILKKD